MSTQGVSPELENMEVTLLLEGVFRHYGYDFRDYSPASLKRRIKERVRAEGADTVSGLHAKVLHDTACMERLLLGLSVNVSSMFRDPGFFQAFRTWGVPLLRTYPFVRIWHAGCSTGEEVYSMAILLQEEGLYDRCRIYATDMNEPVLHRAKEGAFSLGPMQQYAANYLEAGGAGSFSDYYTVRDGTAIFRPSLKQNLVFAHHNLASDGPFNEFHVIICRNVLIYFNRTLQARVHGLFLDSLVHFGFLGLGAKESLRYTPHEERYEDVDARHKLYRRIA